MVLEIILQSFIIIHNGLIEKYLILSKEMLLKLKLLKFKLKGNHNESVFSRLR